MNYLMSKKNLVFSVVLPAPASNPVLTDQKSNCDALGQPMNLHSSTTSAGIHSTTLTILGPVGGRAAVTAPVVAAENDAVDISAHLNGLFESKGEL